VGYWIRNPRALLAPREPGLLCQVPASPIARAQKLLTRHRMDGWPCNESVHNSGRTSHYNT
jgi:hypothetical protein